MLTMRPRRHSPHDLLHDASPVRLPNRRRSTSIESNSPETAMPIVRRVLPLLLVVLGACKSATDEGEPCGVAPYFTSIPVALPDMNAITVIGGFGAPVHTLPTAHAGIYLARAGVTVRSPGAIDVTRLRRTTYLTSAVRCSVVDA